MSKTFKKQALNFYKQWQKEKSYCPALKEKIIISTLGWHHITGQSGAKKRTWNDIYRRLKLLPLAKEIINCSTTIQNITLKDGITYYILEAIKLITIDKTKNWTKVRVIIIESDKQKKTFLSVMDRKIKETKKYHKKNRKVPHASAL